MIRGVRGAITVKENTEAEILEKTERLFFELIERNRIHPDQVASVFISVTEDLSAAFPAKALRKFNDWSYVPVMCMKEIPVPSSLPKCIRVMMHVNTDVPQDKVEHIYLEEAKRLRPDLLKSKL
ncbi:chorismate mutase [Bacillus massilinigeriensis]|uniref:chorismate mutase n=1 Tax=Bacillus mediterraneensis TaxID=1805474 RepID=UPI0008F942FF|nr:chorismate mutase [Bacillus mediterraneensis]